MARKATKAETQARLQRWFRESHRRYGVTEEQIRELWRAQGGRCAICRDPFKSVIPSVDHDHVTGFVRGLLCGGSHDAKTCNRLIGFYSAATLQRAAEYKRNPPAYAVIGRIRPESEAA